MTGSMAPAFARMIKDEPFPLQGGRVRMAIVTLYAILRRGDGVSVRI